MISRLAIAVLAAALPALRARFGALVRELSKFGTVGGIAPREA